MAVIALSMTACNHSNKQSDTASTDSLAVTAVEETPGDIFAVYEGTLPCADCDGILTTLSLHPDSTYEMRSEYLGKKDATFDEKGTFTVSKDQVVELTPEKGDKTYYKITMKGEIALSDSLGHINEGDMAEHYKLRKK